MNKRTLIPLIILFVVLFVALFFYFGPFFSKKGVAYNVDTGLSYLSIQQAIDANETVAGHTIVIYSGVYYENFEITKPLTIKGGDRDSTIIEPGVKPTPARVPLHYPITILLHADNVSVSDLTVRNGVFGIWSLNNTGCRISNNRVVNCTTGIRIDFSSTNIVEANEIFNGTLRGIHLYKSFNNTVMDNHVENISQIYGAGIDLELSYNNTITRNQVMNNDYGIYFYSSSGNKIYHNNFVNNTSPVRSEGFSNFWDDDYPSGGNYWSDYVGLDADGDGIGDTSYIIDVANEDRYPRMEPSSEI